ncbi:hypothetical protein [Paenibacillus baekrokdamisoli]|nr:hypothetical protein [Paenibacillus baekrokdamisoli]
MLMQILVMLLLIMFIYLALNFITLFCRKVSIGILIQTETISQSVSIIAI